MKVNGSLFLCTQRQNCGHTEAAGVLCSDPKSPTSELPGPVEVSTGIITRAVTCSVHWCPLLTGDEHDCNHDENQTTATTGNVISGFAIDQDYPQDSSL